MGLRLDLESIPCVRLWNVLFDLLPLFLFLFSSKFLVLMNQHSVATTENETIVDVVNDLSPSNESYMLQPMTYSVEANYHGPESLNGVSNWLAAMNDVRNASGLWTIFTPTLNVIDSSGLTHDNNRGAIQIAKVLETFSKANVTVRLK